VQSQTRLRFLWYSKPDASGLCLEFDWTQRANVYNGSELITTIGIVDNRNGNDVTLIFLIRHD
jgi:hypothetical protein